MAAAVACPDARVLQQLLLGRMPPDEVERLATHCEQCPACIAMLHTLKADDTLVEALAAQKTAPDQPLEPATRALIERLQRVRPLGPPPELAATVADGDTPSTSGKPAEAPADATQEGFAFLSPSQGPGEMGRLGGYRVLSLLGAGGMGMVLKAEDPRLHRPIALKVMKAEVASNPLARERFLREAQAAAGLHSDHVVTIYQVGEERDVVFLAMEYLEGLSLEDWLRKGRKPTVAQAARIGRQIALGLADAHAQGLIHRDVKPANVWLDSRQQGRAKLLDFGLARAAAVADDHQLTQSGAIVGTPSYMAPEQARGDKIDHRADLFSLGVVLYRLTTGQLPFRGENTMSVLMALAVEQPPSPRQLNPDLPPRLAALIERLLSKDREQRPATARAVADELALIEREASQPIHGGTGVPPVQAQPTGAPLRSRLGKYLVAASLLLVLGGMVAAVIITIRDKQGKTIAEIKAPDGVSVDVRPEGDNKNEPPPKKEPPSPSAALTPVRPGEPLSPMAVVQRPVKLPGVRSWSIEPRHARHTTTAAYRPDGKRLAVGYRDGSIRLWDPDSGRLVQVLVGSATILTLVWSPDGRTLAAGLGEEKRPVRLWDAENGRLLQALEAPAQGNVWSLAWSPDGRNLRACMDDTAYLSWNTADGKLLSNVPTHDRPQAISADARWLAGRDQNDGRTVIWDAEKGKKVRVLDTPRWGHLWSMTWSPEGKRLAFMEENGVHVWDVESGKECFQYAGECGGGGVWSPDGRSLVYCVHPSFNPAIIEVASGAKPRRLEHIRASGFVVWSPDGKTIADIANGLGSNLGWVRLVDAATGKLHKSLSKIADPSPAYSWPANGRTFAFARDGQTTVASVDTGEVRTVLQETKGPLALSPDGTTVVTGGPDHSLILWDNRGKVQGTLTGHDQDPRWVAWSPDGKRLASGAHPEKRVLLWDVVRGELVRELGPLDVNQYQGGRWSPDGRLLAFRNGDAVHLWDVEKNKLANEPKQWKGELLAFSPDSHAALLTGGQSKDVASGKQNGFIMGNPSLAAWSPDGQLLALQLGGRLELWSVGTGRRARRLKGPYWSWSLEDVAFFGDGKLVRGRSGDRLLVWDTDTGRLQGVVLIGESGNVLAVTPEGRWAGSEETEQGIVVVVQKDDGTQELLEPADFKKKYSFDNEPDKVHLLAPLPPPLSVPEGWPMAPTALVHEPAVLPGASSWTIETLSPHGESRVVAYRPDGKLLASGGDDGVVRIWDPARRELVRMLVCGRGVLFLSWSPDGKLLAAGCGGGSLLWEVDSGRLVHRFDLSVEWTPVAWSPTGPTLCLAHGDGLHLWDVVRQRVVRTYQFPTFIMATAWSPDGKTLAVGLQDKTIRLWDAASGKETRKLEGHEKPLGGVAWSPDGKRLVSVGNEEPAFHVWDVVTGKLQRRFAVPLFNEPLQALAVRWSPDGKLVSLGQNGDKYWLYDPDSGRSVRKLDGELSVRTLAWSPDGKQMATAGSGVRLYDADSGKRLCALEVLDHGQEISSFTWSPDARWLALGSGGAQSGLRVEAATGRRKTPLPIDGWFKAAWSADGKRFVTIGPGEVVQVWDMAMSRLVRTLEGKAPGRALAWSADGKRLAIGGTTELRVWSVETGKVVWQKERGADDLAWSPDSQRLATAVPPTDAVCLWDGDGKLLHEVVLKKARAVAWSPDGKTLAAAPWDAEGPCLLIDADTGTVRARTPSASHWYLSWSADGKSLVSFAHDGANLPGEIRTWDPASGALRRAVPCGLPPHSHEYAWSPDGRVLAARGDFEVRLCGRDGRPLGVLLPGNAYQRLAITADGHYRGTGFVEQAIRMVVQRDDGTSETLTPADFAQKYGFQNDPERVRLIDR